MYAEIKSGTGGVNHCGLTMTKVRPIFMYLVFGYYGNGKQEFISGLTNQV